MVDNVNRANRRRGSGFTNISRILDAGRENRLGEAIRSGVTQKGQTVGSGAQEISKGFQQQASGARVGTEQDIEKKESILGKFLGQSGQAEQEAFGEGKREVSDDISTVQGFIKGKYKGPMDIAEQQKQRLGAQASSLQELGEQTRSEGGREELLKRFVGGKGYTQGQRILDNLLLGKTGRENLEEARKSAYQGLNQAREAQNIGLLGQQYAQEAKRFAEGVKQDFEQVGEGIQQSVADEVAKRNLGLKQLRTSERTADTLAADREALANLGLDEFKYLYGVDPTLAQDFTAQEVRDPEQAAKLNALNQMLGGSFDARAMDYSDPETYNKLKALEQAIGQGKSQFEREVVTGQAEQDRLRHIMDTNDPWFAPKYTGGRRFSQLSDQEKINFIQRFAGRYGGRRWHAEGAPNRFGFTTDEILDPLYHARDVRKAAADRFNISDYDAGLLGLL